MKPEYFKKWPVVLFCMFALSLCALGPMACGGGGGGGDDGGTQTGVFVDAVVGGIQYETDTHSGTTNANGEFSYEDGETVTFTIGGIVVGTVNGQAIVTPVDLVEGATDETNTAVTNIVRLLLTLDEDGDPSNGITISQDTLDALEDTGQGIDFAAADFDTEVGDVLFASLGIDPADLVDAATAQAHLQATLLELLSGAWSGTYDGDDTGTWQITVATDGDINGTWESDEVGGDSGAVTGTMNSSGTSALTAQGTAGDSDWQGTFTNQGTASGTWDNTWGDSGTWEGSQD